MTEGLCNGQPLNSRSGIKPLHFNKSLLIIFL